MRNKNIYINSVGYYIPKTRLNNDYFTQTNGLTDEWIVKRTGIKSRARASEKETLDYMASKAVENASVNLSYNIQDVDLIVFASYTLSDTIASTGYYIQQKYNIENAKVFQISSACSSGINGIEIISSFLNSGIATKALLICADRNSTYSNDSDPISGHLWGDASTAFFISTSSYSPKDALIVDITTQGLANIGKGTEGVYLNLKNGGLQMPYGKDVFIHACCHISQNTKAILENNNYTVNDLSFFIAHQANMRILKNVSMELEISDEKVLSNIEELGNTGSASALLVFAQNYNKFKSGDVICISVFGGGYSAGSCLLILE